MSPSSLLLNAREDASNFGLRLEWAIDIINSPFFVALVGAMAGALAGALAAQRIARHSKRIDDMKAEVKHVNACLVISHQICNTALALKKQFIAPLMNKFETDLNGMNEHLETGAPEPFRFQIDFRVFSIPEFSTDALRTIMFERNAGQGRMLALIPMIDDAANGLKVVAELRQKLIDRFQSGEIPNKEISRYYFGKKLESGHTNREYPDSLQNLYSYCDDVIFFSGLLCEDLERYGNSVVKAFAAENRNEQLKVGKIDLESVKKSGFFPPETNYQRWLDGYAEQKEMS